MNKHRIYYKEQLINSDGTKLLEWGEIPHNIGKIIKGKKPRWFEEMREAIQNQENPSVEGLELNPFTLKETKEVELQNGKWVITREGMIGRIINVKNRRVNLSHWNIEGNNITEKCVGCIEHIATRTTAGTMTKLIKDVTPLTVNCKRRIYGNIADIIMAFRRRKKQEEGFAKEIFMSKSTIRSWRFIKNFRNMDEVLMKKHEEIGNKKEVEVEVITEKTGKKKGEKSYLSAIILDTEQKIKFKIENIVWPSKEKLALTSLAILIAICKEKTTIKVNTV